jgi:hypothetical protein
MNVASSELDGIPCQPVTQDSANLQYSLKRLQYINQVAPFAFILSSISIYYYVYPSKLFANYRKHLASALGTDLDE